jgi:hypothetical protein
MPVTNNILIANTNSAIITLYNLEGEFENLLRQYKQAYLNYIALLSKSAPTAKVYSLLNLNHNVKTYCTGNKNTIVQPGTMLTPPQCEALCSASPNCGGYDLSKVDSSGKYKCNLYKPGVTAVQGTKTSYGCYQQVLSPDSNLATTIAYIGSLNTKLISINRLIKTQLDTIQPNSESLTAENQQKLFMVAEKYAQLLIEKNNIDDMKLEVQTIKQENNVQTKNVTHQYSKYIFWLILFCIIIFLTVKLLIFPDFPFNMSKFFFWVIIFSFLFVSMLYLYLPAGFLIACSIAAYIGLTLIGILPSP